MNTLSSNFTFLAAHNLQLVRFGTLAERYFTDDPSTALIKLRQFGEVLAQLTAASSGQYTNPEDSQADLLRRLRFTNILTNETNDLFHQLRIAGNRVTHALAAEAARATALLDRLDQAIAKAFRGELVPQDPDDAAASSAAPPAWPLRDDTGIAPEEALTQASLGV